MKKWARGGTLLAAVSAAMLVAACGSSGSGGTAGGGGTAGLTPPMANTPVPTSVGKGEVKIKMINC